MTRLFWLIFLIAASACSTAEEPPRSVTVTGTGSATAVPDEATLSMSIIARRPALADAQAEATAVAERILELTDRLGIDRDSVDTTGASVRPDYQWDRDNNQQVLRGYIAERRMRIEIDDLDQLGALTEGVVGAGVNQVSPPVLGSSQRRDAYRRALEEAAADAEANARVLATSLGARLGKVITISSGQPRAIPMPGERMLGASRAASDEAPAATYNPADLEFNATITAVFALED